MKIIKNYQVRVFLECDIIKISFQVFSYDLFWYNDVVMKQRESLQRLAQTYFHYLTQRQASLMKPILSLDFSKRQKVTEQLKLIQKLRSLIYGVEIEIYLFEEYLIQKESGREIISPFQFDILYQPYQNPLDSEKTTITIQSVVLEGDEWKVESIINENDVSLLKEMTDKPASVSEDPVKKPV